MPPSHRRIVDASSIFVSLRYSGVPVNRNTPKSIHTLVVSDFPVMGWGLARLIETWSPKLLNKGIAATRGEALNWIKASPLDVALVDIDGDLGPEVIEEILAHSRLKVLALTASPESSVLDAAVIAGATGVVSKKEPVDLLLRAIERICDGEIWLDRRATSRIFQELSRKNQQQDKQKLDNLTPKERLVVDTVMQNVSCPNREIAERMHISENTLRNHLTSIYAKLGLAGRMELFTLLSNNRSR